MSRFSLVRRNAQLDNWKANFNSGLIKIYNGTRPTDVDTALSGNTLLVTCTMNATAFAAASAGVQTANAITSGVAAVTGTPTFARLFQSDGTTVICDLSCAVGSGEVNLAASPSAGATVSITSMTITFGVGS
jgi:hypothetical protein